MDTLNQGGIELDGRSRNYLYGVDTFRCIRDPAVLNENAPSEVGRVVDSEQRRHGILEVALEGALPKHDVSPACGRVHVVPNAAGIEHTFVELEQSSISPT
jgi:hypothetical protein